MLEIKTKVEALLDQRLLLKNYCTGFDLLLLEKGWSDFTDLWHIQFLFRHYGTRNRCRQFTSATDSFSENFRKRPK